MTFTEQVDWLRRAQVNREASQRRHIRGVVIDKRAIALQVVSQAPAWITDAAKRDYLS